MDVERYSEQFFKGPAYALAIGISQYLNGKKPGEVIDETDQKNKKKLFHDLNYAAKDARDFAGFLQKNGMIGFNVKILDDENATLTRIKTEIDELAKRCRVAADSDQAAIKPLVVVFFSGHGMVDARGRHYLLPWEAEADNLVGTALWHKDFWNYLNEIDTNRLVVFLDACHSGTKPERAKGVATYSPLAELGEGQGRYSIASCGPGEYSYEGDSNGIFTETLLSLLRCDDSDAIKEEAIDIFHLYPALRDRVKAAAGKYGPQEPMVNEMSAATGIVLAINQLARDKRVKAEQQNQEKRVEFLQKTCSELTRNDTSQKKIIRSQLKAYIDDGKKVEGYGDFFDLFDAFSDACQRSEPVPGNYCDLLVREHKNAGSQPKSSKESRFQGPPKGTDEFIPVELQSTASSPARPVPSLTPVLAAIPPVEATKRCQLAVEDQNYILAEAERNLDFYDETKLLRDQLNQPIFEEQFSQQVHAIGKERNDDATSKLLKEIIRRFREKWPNAKVVETQKLSSIISGQNR